MFNYELEIEVERVALNNTPQMTKTQVLRRIADAVDYESTIQESDEQPSNTSDYITVGTISLPNERSFNLGYQEIKSISLIKVSGVVFKGEEYTVEEFEEDVWENDE